MAPLRGAAVFECETYGAKEKGQHCGWPLDCV